MEESKKQGKLLIEKLLADLKDKKYRRLAIFALVLWIVGLYYLVLFPRHLIQQPIDFCSSLSPTSDPYYYQLCDLSSINNLNGLAVGSGIAAAVILFLGLIFS